MGVDEEEDAEDSDEDEGDYDENALEECHGFPGREHFAVAIFCGADDLIFVGLYGDASCPRGTPSAAGRLYS